MWFGRWLMSAIKRYLRGVELERLKVLRKKLRAGEFEYIDRCKCLLGIVGGGTTEGYDEQVRQLFGARADEELCDFGGRADTCTARDRQRIKALLPLVREEIARRQKRQ
jgi:hypothetical protein